MLHGASGDTVVLGHLDQIQLALLPPKGRRKPTCEFLELACPNAGVELWSFCIPFSAQQLKALESCSDSPEGSGGCGGDIGLICFSWPASSNDGI